MIIDPQKPETVPGDERNVDSVLKKFPHSMSFWHYNIWHYNNGKWKHHGCEYPEYTIATEPIYESREDELPCRYRLHLYDGEMRMYDTIDDGVVFICSDNDEESFAWIYGDDPPYDGYYLALVARQEMGGLKFFINIVRYQVGRHHSKWNVGDWMHVDAWQPFPNLPEVTL